VAAQPGPATVTAHDRSVQVSRPAVATNPKGHSMTWSKLINTELGQKAKARYGHEPYRRYHNWDHVQRLYWHAENTLGLAYDPALDQAILAHDVIYDAQGNNEIRSADWLYDNAPDALPQAGDMILRTIDHAPDAADNRIVLLDLLDFADPAKRLENSRVIEEELCAIHGMSSETYHRASIGFLSGLAERLSDEELAIVPAADLPHFIAIRRGIEASVDRSKELLATWQRKAS
jgi:predicted metal-dependent HD superfamily phosphohydrolase